MNFSDMDKKSIGVFDSGLGGLWILKHMRESMPLYNYVFFGDEAHVPYGTKSIDELFEYSTKALDFLYGEQNCLCVVLACNTTSASIYDRLKDWLKEKYPNRKLFGIVRPTLEAIDQTQPVVVFGTERTIESHVYKNNLKVDTTEIILPQLASMIEHGENTSEYIKSFSSQVREGLYTGILACTHYGMVREDFKNAFPQIKKFIYQEEILPNFFKKYIEEDSLFEESLAKDGLLFLYTSKENNIFTEWKDKWFGVDQKILNIEKSPH